MRINKIDISKIHFHYQKYDPSLYQCIDGHKRLSVLQDILQDHISYSRGSFVPVIIKNLGNDRSNDCWRGRNHH